MRKQEYIHLHALLAEVSTDLSERGEDLDLDEYESLGVRPSGIHKSKSEHKTAVLALANGLTDSVAGEEKSRVPAGAN